MVKKRKKVTEEKGEEEKKVCRYTGNEPSPKGRGFCARFQKVGDWMYGKKGGQYVVRLSKANVKSWKPYNPKIDGELSPNESLPGKKSHKEEQEVRKPQPLPKPILVNPKAPKKPKRRISFGEEIVEEREMIQPREVIHHAYLDVVPSNGELLLIITPIKNKSKTNIFGATGVSYEDAKKKLIDHIMELLEYQGSLSLGSLVH